MSEKLRDSINSRCELLTKTLKALENKIKLLPEGTIKIKKTKYNNYFLLCIGEKEVKYLNTGDNELIKQLIQKSYLKDSSLVTRKELSILNKVSKAYPSVTIEDMYDSLSDERKDYATPIIPGDDEYAQKWMAVPYKRKPFKKDAPEFYTLKHERVRSKSEVIIADRLNAKGIPYKYECPLKIGNETIHPDFSILKMSIKKVVYYEHCGKMDDPEYTKDMSERSHLYTSAKIFQGDRLFYTFETSDDPLDIKMLDEFIENSFR